MNKLSLLALLFVFSFKCVSSEETQGLYNMTQLNSFPTVRLYENFLTEDECNYLITLGKDQLKRCEVMDKPKAGEEKNQTSEARTSFGSWIEWNTDPIVRIIENRIAKITGLPVENGENFYLLRYRYGQEYKPHYDFFSPSEPTLRFGGQRIVSIVIYLNDVEAGGETIFPQLNLSVTPARGSALLFHNCDADGNPNPSSLHGSVPIVSGEKWAMTKWLRQGPFQTLRQQYYSICH